MFNKYIWDMYKNSSEGRYVIRVFVKNLGGKYNKSYSEKVCKLLSKFLSDEKVLNDEREDLLTLAEMFSENPPEKISADGLSEAQIIETAERYFSYFYESFSDGGKDERTMFGEFSDMLTINSTCFTAVMPDFFVPYYYADDLGILRKIGKRFDIGFPPKPKKSEYKKRAFYYLDICKALFEFRLRNGLTPYELFAFLYDFAPQYIGGENSVK